MAGLAAGQYQVQFGTLPTCKFTPQDQGTNDATDSDADASGKTAVFTLAQGQMNATVDAGLAQPCNARIGDFVWNDTNGNGIRDSGEGGAGPRGQRAMAGSAHPGRRGAGARRTDRRRLSAARRSRIAQASRTVSCRSRRRRRNSMAGRRVSPGRSRWAASLPRGRTRTATAWTRPMPKRRASAMRCATT
ncbi:MAG: hypothetical protein JSR59_11550 [Proteobacteria bacterium]|nr:hypothetical protein [Pseudomonadota bacterium]